MFARARDLLVYEPGLPGEVDWSGQRLLENGEGVLSGGGVLLTLTNVPSVSALGVVGGELIRVEGVWGEVVSVGPPSSLLVSRLRSDPDGDPIGLAGDTGSATGVRIIGYGAQLAAVHRSMLESLRLDSDGLGLSSVLNPRSVARVEALGALSLIYEGAAGRGVGSGVARDSASLKGVMYRERFEHERSALSVRVDTDGDGLEDEVRSPMVRRRENSERMWRGD